MDVYMLMGGGFAVSCKREIDGEDFTPGIVKCKFVCVVYVVVVCF